MDVKNIAKFSFRELFNNENGKTCIQLVCGFLIVSCGVFLVIKGGIVTPANQDMISKAVETFLIAGAYLGVNKWIQSKSDIAGVGMTTTQSTTDSGISKDGANTSTETNTSMGTIIAASAPDPNAESHI